MPEPDENPGPMRLFVALPVPARFADGLESLPRGELAGKWSPAGDYHITLRFLGDLPLDSVPHIKSALARVRRPAFHVEVGGMDAFENRPETILYARVDSTRKMNALCGDITDVLTPLGFDFGTRPFAPHITLARLKNSRGVSQYIEKYEENVKGRWLADSFSLMRSGPAGEGGKYRALAGYPLLP